MAALSPSLFKPAEDQRAKNAWQKSPVRDWRLSRMALLRTGPFGHWVWVTEREIRNRQIAANYC
jgi:hypothetical protein